MPTNFDVAARLAQARPAVDNTQCYVWACHLLDYQNPDLTQHSAQVRDWFSSEDGMDLHVLDADCASMNAAAAAADHALSQEREQLRRLSTAWQGAGAASAEDFVRRHCDAAEQVASSVRAAAQALAGLRDTLWQIVDTKASAVCAIDDRHKAERQEWLGAAQTVNTGVGDRVAASELVDRKIKPFVDNDIRGDWLNAMRTAISSIDSSYDAATAGLIAAPPARFDVPGDFGPGGTHSAPPPPTHTPPPSASPSAPAAPSAPTSPSSYPAAPPPYPPPAALPAPPMPSAPLPATAGVPAAAATPPTPGPLDALPQQFADTLTRLLPSHGEQPLALDPALDDPAHGAPPDKQDEKKVDDKPDDEKGCGAEKDHEAKPDNPAAEPDPTTPEDPPGAPDQPPVEPPPSPAERPPPPSPYPPDPPATPQPPVDPAKTPCEIAADELPQAGQ